MAFELPLFHGLPSAGEGFFVEFSTWHPLALRTTSHGARDQADRSVGIYFVHLVRKRETEPRSPILFISMNRFPLIGPIHRLI
jgi:hypothetical protein